MAFTPPRARREVPFLRSLSLAIEIYSRRRGMPTLTLESDPLATDVSFSRDMF